MAALGLQTVTATFFVGDAIETPWHHVHIEYDEATGGYSLIEFCEVADCEVVE